TLGRDEAEQEQQRPDVPVRDQLERLNAVELVPVDWDEPPQQVGQSRRQRAGFGGGIVAGLRHREGGRGRGGGLRHGPTFARRQLRSTPQPSPVRTPPDINFEYGRAVSPAGRAGYFPAPVYSYFSRNSFA